MSGVSQRELRQERRRERGPAVDQLNFLDLLYAVPVSDLAMRVSGAALPLVSAAQWSALAVILATIVFSWIGLHKNRAAIADDSHGRGPIGQIPFASLRFVQFMIEIIIVAMYFAMGLFLRLPTTSDSAVHPPAEDWLTGLLLGIFLLYAAWDLIDTRLAGSGPWRELASAGARVTITSLLPAAVIFGAVAATQPRTGDVVVPLNAALVILLYAYRAAQDSWGNTRPEEEAGPAVILVVSE